MFRSRYEGLFSPRGQAADIPFIPIHENMEPLYHFDLQRWFYASEADRQRDLRALANLKVQVTALNPGVAQSREAT